MTKLPTALQTLSWKKSGSHFLPSFIQELCADYDADFKVKFNVNEANDDNLNRVTDGANDAFVLNKNVSRTFDAFLFFGWCSSFNTNVTEHTTTTKINHRHAVTDEAENQKLTSPLNTAWDEQTDVLFLVV